MVVDQNQAVGEAFYPPIEPYRRDLLDVGGGHRVYFEESGNPHGIPVIFVHGGPGSQSRPAHRRFFDPDFYRIILFDQRGCGQSTPLGSLSENTTPHLIADMDRLRRHLKVERWLLFGGSWGSTLSLAYALSHADQVAGMILRGVFLGSRAEVDWFLSGVRGFVPEAWVEFARDAVGSLVEHYRRQTDSPEQEVALAAAKRWCDYEARVMEPANPSASAGAASQQEILARVRVQLHFLANDFFLQPNELPDNLWRIGTKPVTIVQGRLDMVCRPVAAAAVAQGIEGSELRIVATGGHSALQPEIAAALCAATRRMRARIQP
ncbi:MAG: prolyl aminopeptidase [Betaproteobacteria bacterium]|nr:prolyl aminopeptidase [Betaproteobacteria bacterium]